MGKSCWQLMLVCIMLTADVGTYHVDSWCWYVYKKVTIKIGKFWTHEEMSRLMTKPAKWHVRPAKTQISLGIHPVWSESLLSTWRKLGTLAPHWAHSEDSDQTGWMIRLGGCPSWSGSLLGTQSFCWFCHEAAQIAVIILNKLCGFTLQ